MLPETVVVVKVGWVPEGEIEGTEGKTETGETRAEKRTRRYERAKEEDGE